MVYVMMRLLFLSSKGMSIWISSSPLGFSSLKSTIAYVLGELRDHNFATAAELRVIERNRVTIRLVRSIGKSIVDTILCNVNEREEYN
jgi:hypothetical protein